MKKAVCLLLLVSSLLVPTTGQNQKLTATEAKDHIGEKATVCGTVASARYADRTNGQPTFLNLDEAYPKNIFTILIWGSNRAKFGEPEVKYANARLCVTGTIATYRGSPEIIATDPDQISVQHYAHGTSVVINIRMPRHEHECVICHGRCPCWAVDCMHPANFLCDDCADEATERFAWKSETGQVA